MDLLHAVEHANRVCDWMENLDGDEMPPAWMWPFEEELADWFEAVKQARDEKYGNSSDGTNAGSSVPMMANEMAEGRG